VIDYRIGPYSSIRGFSKRSVVIFDLSGIHVVDFSNPKKPKEVGYYDLPQDYWGISENSLALGPNNMIYAVTYPNGLYVLRYLPPSE
jgi:hypothetical protein